MNKTLSVIVPAYNMEKYLDRCLSSLIVSEEQMGQLEVLVINDGSKDLTSETARRFEQGFPQTFRVIDKGNGHYGSCVNRGLSEAKGTFVKILDADDSFNAEVLCDYLRFLYSEEVSQQADLVISGYMEVSDKGPVGKSWKYSHIMGPFALNQLSQEDAEKWFIHALCYRTRLLKDIHYKQTEGIAYTDHEWSFLPLSVVKNCFSFDGLPYRYTIGREGQSVAPASQAKNLWMESDVITKMVRTFHSLRNDDKTDRQALSFMEKVLHKDLLHLFQLYLVTYYGITPSLEPLTKLDLLLKDTLPDLYSSLGEYTTRIAGARFMPIKNWRESRNGLLAIQRITYSIANAINSLR